MKLFTSTQIKAWEQYTCEQEHITSLHLMERAAQACVQYINQWCKEEAIPCSHVTIFCGTGNNGGDGVVIARLLSDCGIVPAVYVLPTGSSASQEFSINTDRLKNETSATVHYINTSNDFPEITPGTLLLDCLFGTGLNRPVQGLGAELIEHINRYKSFTISVDVPSGLPADIPESGNINGYAIIKADRTITFQQPKRSFLFADAYAYTGEVMIAGIGLSAGYARQTPCDHFYITPQLVRPLVKPRVKFSHKGTFGHVLLIAGSSGKMGAALLASRSAMRAGCGLLTAYIPESGRNIIQTALPEAMVLADPEKDYCTTFPAGTNYSAIGAGPGIGVHNRTREAIRQWLPQVNKPLVLDADALNNIAQLMADGTITTLPANTIITPHPKEFARLTGESSGSYETYHKQIQFAKQYQCVVILKGAHTAVALPDGSMYFNSTGNPLLATAGSGDVLTGIITSLLAQGYTTREAAILGVYLHGACADRVLSRCRATMLASEIGEELPALLFELSQPD
jgi:ADP-dependent NAD(P)H-hydrate dehydratase / NAD(P)H-hydrate epimerase